MKFQNEKELVEWVYDMHLQNLSGRENFEEAFKNGIESTIEELKILNFEEAKRYISKLKHSSGLFTIDLDLVEHTDSRLRKKYIELLKWVGDGHNLDVNAEKIVDEFLKEKG